MAELLVLAAGKSRVLALGAALALLLAAGTAMGGSPGAPLVSAATADGLTSARQNAAVTLGGELRVDYSYRYMTSGGAGGYPGVRRTDLEVRNLNLRLKADVHPNLTAMFKIDLTHQKGRTLPGDDILEEALLVMHSIAGTGLGFFAGQGRAPYGQDIALGIIQSYHHLANRDDSSEGRIFIIDPPGVSVPVPGCPDSTLSLPPMRPGQFDRAFLAGVSYEWDGRWRIEAACFQPDFFEYKPRLEAPRRVNGSDLGFAGRVWWSPVEELVLEASALAAHSTTMGMAPARLDLPASSAARKNAYALSLGFDWRREPWRIFGEWQRSWDWNFSKGYATQAWQLGLAREFSGGWRAGGMAETLRIADALGTQTVDRYYKLAFNIRYAFNTNLFILGEYGHEWFRRTLNGALSDKRRGAFAGVRVGFTF